MGGEYRLIVHRPTIITVKNICKSQGEGEDPTGYRVFHFYGVRLIVGTASSSSTHPHGHKYMPVGWNWPHSWINIRPRTLGRVSAVHVPRSLPALCSALLIVSTIAYGLRHSNSISSSRICAHPTLFGLCASWLTYRGHRSFKLPPPRVHLTGRGRCFVHLVHIPFGR